jgi:hypothetical protein
MVVDVRINAPKARRRLISISNWEERQAIDQAKELFHGVDCGISGPEGDYRKRLYLCDKASKRSCNAEKFQSKKRMTSISLQPSTRKMKKALSD